MNRLHVGILSAAALLAIAGLAFSQEPAAGQGKGQGKAQAKGKGGGRGPQAPVGPTPRMADGKPDLSGLWFRPYTPNMASGPAKDTRQGDPTGPKELPFTAAYKAKWDAYKPDDGDYTGESCGLVVRLPEGKSVYFAGDTCVFGDMQLIGRLYSPDVAVLPIGGHFTMDPREAGVALELLGARQCIPCHYGTFPLLAGTPDELRQHAPDGVEILEMQPGQTVTV